MPSKFVFVKKNQLSYECSICTELIQMQGMVAPIWSCFQGCKSIFHLECVKNWGIATLGHAIQFSCPNCRCSAYDLNSDVNESLRCFCGKNSIKVTKKMPYSLLTCGSPCQALRYNCTHPCPLQCHPGPCPPCSYLGPPEPCATGLPLHFAQQQRRCGSTPKPWFCNEPCPRLYSKCYLQSHKCPVTKCHSECQACPEQITISCECSLIVVPSVASCSKVFELLTLKGGKLSCQQQCKSILNDGKRCLLICHPSFVPCVSEPTCDPRSCFYFSNHSHNVQCRCGESTIVCPRVDIIESEIGFIRYLNSKEITCNLVCGKKISSCSRHLCNMKCCVKNLTNHDRCIQICNRRLSCGKSNHKCLEICHPERPSCRPCLRLSYPDRWICPCGKTKVEGPLGCTWRPPQCTKNCNRLQPGCNHYIPHSCHSGTCPPCTYPIYPKCGCGRIASYSIPCMFSEKSYNCGLKCTNTYSTCPHSCSVRCHPDSDICPPCPSLCYIQKTTCGHPCSLICGTHSETCLCSTLVTKFCPCSRFKRDISCSSFDAIAIECTDDCFHAQRYEALSLISKTPNNTTLNTIEVSISTALSYWPTLIELINWASTHLDYVLMLERLFSSHILARSRKRWVDLPPAGSIKRAMTILIAKGYNLQTIELDSLQKGSIRFGFPDDYPKAIPLIPKVLLSNVVSTLTIYEVKAFLSQQSTIYETEVVQDHVPTSPIDQNNNLIPPPSLSFCTDVDSSSSDQDEMSDSKGWTVVKNVKRLSIN